LKFTVITLALWTPLLNTRVTVKIEQTASKENPMKRLLISIFATLVICATLGLTLKLLPFCSAAVADENKAKEMFPRERTLYTNPTATVYLDGLMVFCHDGSTFQAGIHTATEPEHVVTVLIRKEGRERSHF